MKLSILLRTVLVLPIALVFSHSQNETFIAEEVQQISACGLSCLETTIPRVGCELLDFNCSCASQQLVKITAQCLLANCTLEESVELDRIQAAICERPYQSRNGVIRISTIVCMVITYTAIAVRLATRYCLHQGYKLDDWLMIGACCTDTVFAALGIAFEHHGFGEHVWEIDVHMIPKLLYWFYLCEIFYIITFTLIKTSILTFYLRVFPTRSFRIQCWSVVAFCILCSFAFTVVTIFQCHPVSYVWDKNIAGGRCVNFNSATWANGAINILQDLLIIVLPISEVRKLQLERRKKLGLYVMFGLGGFVCIASMVRFSTLKGFGLTEDPTWDNIPLVFWTTLETTTAFLCACLPSIRAGLLRFFPGALGSSVAGASAAASSNRQSNGVYGNARVSPVLMSGPSYQIPLEASWRTRPGEPQPLTYHVNPMPDVEIAKMMSRFFVSE